MRNFLILLVFFFISFCAYGQEINDEQDIGMPRKLNVFKLMPDKNVQGGIKAASSGAWSFVGPNSYAYVKYM
jgi:hypothetical protein